MKQVLLTSMLLTLKRYWKRKGFMISIILLPFLIFQLGKATETQNDAWRIALYAEEEGLATETIETLCGEQNFLEFYNCDSLETLQQDVLGKRAECGFYFKNGFEEIFYQGMMDEGIVIYDSPSSVATKMAREEVFANVLKNANEPLLYKFLNENIGENNKQEIHELYQKYAKTGNVFHFEYEEINNSQNSHATNQIMVAPVRGLLALFICAEILFAMLLCYEDEQHGVLKSMRRAQRISWRGMTIMIPGLFAGAVSLFILKITCHTVFEWQVEILYLLGYLLLCAFMALALFYLFKNSATYVCAVTVFLSASVVVNPIFISLEMLFPKAANLQYLLAPGVYLSRFLNGDTRILWIHLIIYFVIYVSCLTYRSFFDRI